MVEEVVEDEAEDLVEVGAEEMEGRAGMAEVGEREAERETEVVKDKGCRMWLQQRRCKSLKDS